MRTLKENIEGDIQLLEEIKEIRKEESQAADDEADNESLVSWQVA